MWYREDVGVALLRCSTVRVWVWLCSVYVNSQMGMKESVYGGCGATWVGVEGGIRVGR